MKFIERLADSLSENSGCMRRLASGDERLGRELEQVIAGKVVDGRAIELVDVGPAERVRSCNVRFVASSPAGGLREMLAQLQGAPVLTVQENSGPLAWVESSGPCCWTAGCASRLTTKPAARAGLKISSKLQALAQNGGRGGYSTCVA